MDSPNIDINQLIDLKNDILRRRRNIDINDINYLSEIKDMNREYGRIQMKIKYYSDEDYRKEKCRKVKEFNKINIDIYNNYQKLYQRNKNKK